jgi:hypothetical protein
LTERRNALSSGRAESRLPIEETEAMRSKYLRAAVLAAGVAVALGCAMQKGVMLPGRDAQAPRRVDGLVEPIILKPAATYTTEAERLALVERAAAHRIELLGRFPPPLALCRRVPDGAVRVNGELSAGEWDKAMVVSGFRLTRELTPCRQATRAMLLWDSTYLYMAFDCEDADVTATITERDGELWREDAVEVFIDANADEMSYLEFELSARGVFYDAAVADYRPEIDWPPDLSHLDIDRGISIYTVVDTQAKARVDGTLNKPDDSDRGWTCEMAISWLDIARGTNVRRLPPRDGDVWRIGLYRVNVNVKADEKLAEYSAWNPTTSWFHVPSLFGRVLFVE